MISFLFWSREQLHIGCTTSMTEFGHFSRTCTFATSDHVPVTKHTQSTTVWQQAVLDFTGSFFITRHRRSVKHSNLHDLAVVQEHLSTKTFDLGVLLKCLNYTYSCKHLARNALVATSFYRTSVLQTRRVSHEGKVSFLLAQAGLINRYTQKLQGDE